MNLATRCAIGRVILLLTGPASAATTVTVGTDPTKFVIKGTLVTPDQVLDGELVIEGDTITCVAASCTEPAGATRVTVTNGYILPGFVDAHNHVAYNVLPRWTPPKLYKNRGQWQGSDAYKVFKKPYDDLTNKGLTCEMIKYGEVNDHIFDELRTAAEVNEEDFGGAIPDADWIKMITVNPAKALALDAFIGRLAPGLKADITVLRARDDDPTKSVMKTHLQDVQMVWVGGDLLYANRAILDKIKPGECEAMLVYGSAKKGCVKNTKLQVPKAAQTLEDIRTILHTNYPILAPLTP